VFNHAKAKKAYHGDNPVKGVRLPEMTRREAHALSFEQSKLLLAHLSSPAKEMALLSITASLNVSEMLGLCWKHVNLSEAVTVVGTELIHPMSLVVRENYYRGERCSPKAKSRRRTIPLCGAVREALAAMKLRPDFSGPEDPVFCSSTGQPLDEHNVMRRLIKPVAVSLGMPWVSWHVFRHTHATLGEQAGMALSDRQAQMGHADGRMTMHYTHSDLERRRSGIEKMAGLLMDQTGMVVN
jgi:integrase